MNTSRRARHTTGFTLIELMVVLVILAVATSLITLSVSAATGHVLESSAEQLAATLEEARWRAIATGRRIALETPAGQAPLWYEQMADGMWRMRVPSAGDVYPEGVTLQIAQNANTAALPRAVLGPEPVGAAICVQLNHEGTTMAVLSDGVAPFAMKRAGCQ